MKEWFKVQKMIFPIGAVFWQNRRRKKVHVFDF